MSRSVSDQRVFLLLTVIAAGAARNGGRGLYGLELAGEVLLTRGQISKLMANFVARGWVSCEIEEATVELRRRPRIYYRLTSDGAERLHALDAVVLSPRGLTATLI